MIIANKLTVLGNYQNQDMPQSWTAHNIRIYGQGEEERWLKTSQLAQLFVENFKQKIVLGACSL